MAEPGVLLRLSTGPEPDTHRLADWLASLHAAPGPRWIELVGAETLPASWTVLCQRHGVTAGAAVNPGAVVVAHASDVPASSLVRRLVAALAVSESDVVAARTLPLDGPVRCLAARPGALVALESRDDVPRHPPAVVFHDSAPEPVTLDGPPPQTGHPAALPSTTVGRLLSRLEVDAGWAPAHHVGPFLTVITRTRGTRLQCLEETLLCLGAQHLRDFEVVLACHRTNPAQLDRLRELVARQPDWLRDRVRVIAVDRAGRAAPLNVGLDIARGRYAVALDDDDTVTAGWVSGFAALERSAPGKVLRSLALRQDVSHVDVDTPDGVMTCPVPEGAPREEWPARFSLIDHLGVNLTPCMTAAFPRGVFHDLGQRYDESLDTTEDWDYLVRAAGVVGVEDSGTATAIYRWWVDGESSRDEHAVEEWKTHHRAIQDGFDREILLLAPGSTGDVRRLLAQLDEMRTALDRALRAEHDLEVELEGALSAHREAVRAHDQAVAAHDRAIAFVAAREAELDTLRDTVARLRERLRRRQANQERRLDLLRRAHDLLADRRDVLPAGRSLFDLDGAELRTLIEGLDRRR